MAETHEVTPRAALEMRSIDALSLRRFLAEAEGDRVISPLALGKLLGHATRLERDGRIEVEVLVASAIEPGGGARRLFDPVPPRSSDPPSS